MTATIRALIASVEAAKQGAPKLPCPRCGKAVVLLPLDGVTQEEIDRAPFILVRCSDLGCDGGSATGLLGGSPAYLRRCGLLTGREP